VLVNLPYSAKEPINAIAFAKDGKTFATASYFNINTEMTALVYFGNSIWNLKRR
jgi:hypothetical protein